MVQYNAVNFVGGEGVTLREALKNEIVEVVKMIGIDEEMVLESKEHLQELSDRSDLISSNGCWCGELSDKRENETKTIFDSEDEAWVTNCYSSRGSVGIFDP